MFDQPYAIIRTVAHERGIRGRAKRKERRKVMNEKILNVPLDNETRDWLDAEAQANGRSVSREAAQIIKAAKQAKDN